MNGEPIATIPAGCIDLASIGAFAHLLESIPLCGVSDQRIIHGWIPLLESIEQLAIKGFDAKLKQIVGTGWRPAICCCLHT